MRRAVEALAGGAHYDAREVEAWVGLLPDAARVRGMMEEDEFLVAEGGMAGSVVGFASLREGDEVDLVYVDADHAGRGVGARLLAEVEALGWARGAAALRLTSSLNAVGFYERRGWRRVAEGARASGGVALGVVEMRKTRPPG